MGHALGPTELAAEFADAHLRNVSVSALRTSAARFTVDDSPESLRRPAVLGDF